MNIYLDSGYVDMRKIINLNIPFVFMVGGRGTGKTYGALDVLIEDKTKFMFLRRTQTQADLINKPRFTPFKPIARDKNIVFNYKPLTKNNMSVFVNDEDEPRAITGALSTISNIRGFDALEIKVLVLDEFIPEKHERPIKHEADAFFNAYETINRNRELLGKPPLVALCLANPNDLANPLFIELGLVRIAQRMKKKGQETYINRDRGIAIFMLDESIISKAKSATALYKLTEGSDFEKMSIENKFSSDKESRIKSKSLKEYKPIVLIGELCIYEHKHTESLYATTHVTGSPPRYGTSEADRARFIKVYRWIWDDYMDDNIEFEEYLCEILLTKVFKRL